MSLLRQSIDAADLRSVRQGSCASPVLVFCSVCCKSAKQSELLSCDHVACPAKYHLNCLRTALQELHQQRRRWRDQHGAFEMSELWSPLCVSVYVCARGFDWRSVCQ